MEEGLKRENYEKFIQLASHMGETGEGEELFTFNLDALARIVDVAFLEGQIHEMEKDPEYAEDYEKIQRRQSIESLIENALPEGFVETE
jgi:hypothetical protein